METRLLTNSMRRKFGFCPRAFEFAYVQMKRPVKKSEALDFGSLMHRLLEQWWLAPKDERLNFVRDALSQEEPSRDIYRFETAFQLMVGYDKKWKDQEYKTISTETFFTAPLLNPETMASSRTWEIAGKMDAIAEKNGNVILVEHKTTSEDIEITSNYWPKLMLDGQISQYYLGAKALGYEVTECLYDVIRKPSMRPYSATPEESRKYKKNGTLYETQHAFDESVEDWGKRLAEDIEKRPERYFARKPIPRAQNDLEDYLFDMWDVGRSIADAERLKRFPRNPNSCIGFGTCEYFGVCTGTQSIDDEEIFETLDTPNPELK